MCLSIPSKIKSIDTEISKELISKEKEQFCIFIQKMTRLDVLPMLAISEIIMLRLPSKDLLLLG